MPLINTNSLLPSNWIDYPLKQIALLAPIQRLTWPLLNEKQVEVAVKRDDLLDSELSGNKFYKLYAHLLRFKHSGLSTLATFGGAYSNHIFAVAAAGKALNIPTVGVIRGELPLQLSPTLTDAQSMGMTLTFVSRAEYKKKQNPDWLSTMAYELGGSVYWVPEGGGDELGAEGCAIWCRQAITLAPWQPTHLCVAVGTGGTAAGCVAGSNIPVHGFWVLKSQPEDAKEFTNKVMDMAVHVRKSWNEADSDLSKFYLETDFHCGGYARFPNTLKNFMHSFEDEMHVPLDPVYTAKLFWGIAQKAKAGYWPNGSKLLVFHTGGLQGRRGYSL